MKKVFFGVGLIAIIAKISGFARELALSYFFGASAITDAYIIALTIPTVIFNFVGVGFNSGYIPIYSMIKKRSGQDEAIKFTTNFLNLLLVICTGIYIIGMIFTPNIIKIFASGFTDETLKLTTNFTRICFVGVYIVVMVSIFSAFLQANNSFYVVAFLSVPMNIIYIIGTYVAYKKGIKYLPIFSILAISIQLLFLYFPMKKNKYKYSFYLKIQDNNIKRILYLSIPAIIGGSLEQINYLIDRTIASRVMVGGISILNYASRLNIAIIGILLSAVISVLFPKISLLVSERKIDELKIYVRKTVSLIIIFCLPFSLWIMVFSKEIITVVFGRGLFDKNMIETTSKCLFYYTSGFIFMLLREVITKIYYSFKDTKTPVINSGIGIILNIVLNIVLPIYMGISGIAFATSIALVLTTILLVYKLKKKYGDFYIKRILFTFFKVLITSILMTIATYFFKQFLINYSIIIQIIVPSIIIGILYLIFIFFSFNEVSEILKK
ncbi:murein biosynthesis integral membrane protein MurJ [Fusobacterium nucleatum]|uniref:murein biosynthesis integral membrane protein MurJ n=1 Tax=Fusobacterium nucleatum TaxID=851 RepID=UPI003CFE5B1F